MGEVLDGKDRLTATDFAAMLSAGVAAVQGLGDAKPGDKTLVDVLVPARTAFDKAIAEGKSFAQALQALKEAAAAGLESTRDMVAKVGRASRLGERSRGTLDAGAASCDMILETMADGLIKQLLAAT
jgi:dihydroxyacetone kinase-like protein